MMNVLVGCEFSGIVRDAFTAQGHDAWSCDLEPTERPGPHIQGTVLDVLEQGWDLALFFPPCTYLCNSGARWWPQRQTEQQAALALVRTLLDAPIPRIALENPEGLLSRVVRQPDQIIHPWQHGHDASKSTCLWLRGLPCLVPTHFVEAPFMRCGACQQVFPSQYGFSDCPCLAGWTARPVYSNQCASGQSKLGGGRARARSRTYPGIAAAMASQWGTAYLRERDQYGTRAPLVAV
jgi:hypothetical protein